MHQWPAWQSVLAARHCCFPAGVVADALSVNMLPPPRHFFLPVETASDALPDILPGCASCGVESALSCAGLLGGSKDRGAGALPGQPPS